MKPEGIEKLALEASHGNSKGSIVVTNHAHSSRVHIREKNRNYEIVRVYEEK